MTFNDNKVGKVLFRSTSFVDATRLVIDLAVRSQPVPVRLANAYCVATASSDFQYAELLSRVGVNFPDGQPVAWVMRLNAQEGIRPERIRGPSLFRAVIDEGRRVELRHFFLGTTDATLDALRKVIALDYPDTIIAGMFAPPFAPLSDDFYSPIVRRILESKANIVWVALGSPKQDFAAEVIAKLTSVPCVGVGAAFDFLAGTQDEAPLLVQRSGFEWLYRFFKEPRRLWRRYVFGNVKFVIAFLGERRR